MPTYVYPTASDLRQVEQNLLPRLTADDPLFDFLPIETVDEDVLEWEQRDNFVGLQQVRGLNGQPGRVARVGGKRYLAQPGYYGEYLPIDERELTKRRPLGQREGFIEVSDLVRQLQDQLLNRRLDRIRQIGWTLLTAGTFSVANGQGVVMHTDSYTFQSHTAAVAWGTVATATPLVDLRAIKLKARGHSVSFGRRAKAYGNTITVNKLLNNANAADLAGKRVDGGNTPNSLAIVNNIFVGDDLPMIVEYDGGYLNDAGTFVPFIPDDTLVIVGERLSGERIGAYRMTRNANNDNAAPGPYTIVKQEDGPPISIEVHDGHNGGPIIELPGSIVVLDCTP